MKSPKRLRKLSPCLSARAQYQIRLRYSLLGFKTEKEIKRGNRAATHQNTQIYTHTHSPSRRRGGGRKLETVSDYPKWSVPVWLESICKEHNSRNKPIRSVRIQEKKNSLKKKDYKAYKTSCSQTLQLSIPVYLGQKKDGKIKKNYIGGKKHPLPPPTHTHRGTQTRNHRQQVEGNGRELKVNSVALNLVV